MRKNFLLGLVVFFLLPNAAWAVPQSMCAEKVLDKGTVEGIYQGMECSGEEGSSEYTCYIQVGLDNGERAGLPVGAGEVEDTKKSLGSVGNRVSIAYEVRQYWNDPDESCATSDIVTSGTILEKKPAPPEAGEKDGAVAYSRPPSLCPEKGYYSGVVEGIYQGVECGDFCYALIKLDNGEHYYLSWGEDEAKQAFGQIGNRVLANYEFFQFWNEFGAQCGTGEYITSGKILKRAPASTKSRKK